MKSSSFLDIFLDYLEIDSAPEGFGHDRDGLTSGGSSDSSLGRVDVVSLCQSDRVLFERYEFRTEVKLVYGVNIGEEDKYWPFSFSLSLDSSAYC